MSGMEVGAVPTEHVIPIWPKVAPHLARAAEYTHGRFELEDILTLLLEGKRQLWVAFDDEGDVKGAVVTSISVYPRKKYLDLTFIGGDEATSWKEPMLKILQHWAYDTGCDGIESSGRAGWARALKDDGYKFLWQTFELPIATEGLGA